MRTGAEGNPDADMGPLPTASKVLLATLVIVWVLIGIYYARMKLKERQNN